MSLPKWIKKYYTNEEDYSDLLKALSIAWEFLEWQKHLADAHRGNVMHPIRYEVGSGAIETMNRIEELGKD